MIRLLLVDDHASFRQPLAFVIGRQEGITVVAQAGSLAEARRAMVDRPVDVAVVDLGLPDGDGVELVRDVRESNPEGAVLVLTSVTDRGHLARAVEAGASGVLHKSCAIQSIVDAVRRLAVGEILFSPMEAIELLGLADRQREDDERAGTMIGRLTRRERDMLQGLADGLDNEAIAARLNISVETVRTHMVNLLHKLSVETRLQALIFAVRHRLVDVA